MSERKPEPGVICTAVYQERRRGSRRKQAERGTQTRVTDNTEEPGLRSLLWDLRWERL